MTNNINDTVSNVDSTVMRLGIPSRVIADDMQIEVSL